MDHRPHILFFSRGKGRGHALPDAAIARELLRDLPEIGIRFVSYGTGAETLRALGWNPIDLDLPEDNPIWDTAVKAARVLDDLRPLLVVSHEECVVLPLAKAKDVPTVFLTDWFAPDDSIYMQAIKFADEVIFLDDGGYQDVPRYLVGKMVYVGAVLENGHTDDLDPAACRTSLGLPPHGLVIVVVPGSAIVHSEALAPILDLVCRAYDGLDDPGKRLIWVTGGADHRLIASRLTDRADVLVMKPHDTIARTMRAASLVITKGNRITTLECEALGVASISISFGHNPPDDNRVARIRSNTALRAKGLDPELLRHRMLEAMARARLVAGVPRDVLLGRCRAVGDRLRHHLEPILSTT